MIKAILLAVLAATNVPFMTQHRNVLPKTEITTNFYGSVTGIVDKAYIEAHGGGGSGGVDTNAVISISATAITNAVDAGYLVNREKDVNGNLTSLTIGRRGSNKPVGKDSLVNGNYCTATGMYSHAEGDSTSAFGKRSHTEGWDTVAYGNSSHAEGNETVAHGIYSHAEGNGTGAEGDYSHTEGLNTYSIGTASHTEGGFTKAVGNYSHSEGVSTIASGLGSHAEGLNSVASGSYSHACGYTNIASGAYSFTIGKYNRADGKCSYAAGAGSKASGLCSHAEGENVRALGYLSYAVGLQSVSSNKSAFVWQGTNIDPDDVPRYYDHGAGTYNINPVGGISGFYIGETNLATYIEMSVDSNSVMSVRYELDYLTNRTAVTIGERPTLENTQGWNWSEYNEYHQNDFVNKDGKVYICIVDCQSHVPASSWEDQEEYWVEVKTGENSFVQGCMNVAGPYFYIDDDGVTNYWGSYVHAEGYSTHAEGDDSHAEGIFTHAEGEGTHAEGRITHAEGDCTHAEGVATHAEGSYTHAEGDFTHAEGLATHAEGSCTRAGRSTTNDTTTSSDYGYAAHAAGWGAWASNQTSFVWQGVPYDFDAWQIPETNQLYYDHGAGTFNLNPVGGLSGLWIGETNMAAHIGAMIGDVKSDRITATNGLSTIYADGTWLTRTNATDGVVETNALCTVAAASAMTNDATIVRYDANGAAGAKLKHGDTAVTAGDVGALPAEETASDYYKVSPGVHVSWLDISCNFSIGPQYQMYWDGQKGVLGGSGSVWYYGGTDASHEIAVKGDIPDAYTRDEADAAFATKADELATRAIVQTWEGFLDGSNVVFSITNYISGSYNLAAAKLRIMEMTNGVYREVYNSRGEIVMHLENFKTNDFRVATNSVITAVNEAIAQKADKAWGKYTSTGEDVTSTYASNTVFITEPTTVFAGGTEYKRFAVGEGAICVLTTHGAPVYTTGEEGVFKFQDLGGTNYFGFAKTDSYTIGANTDGITTGNQMVNLTYNVTMQNHPCVWYKEDISSATAWEQLNLPDGTQCPGASHYVQWEPNPPAETQICHINVGSAPKGFFKATIEVEGESKFITNMPADLMAGIICTNSAAGRMGVVKPSYNGSTVTWTWSEL